MHAKTDSEVTSLAASSPPRSPRRPIYYVMSPSHPDAEKMSLGGSTPGGSPVHHHHHYPHHPHHHRYASSPIHHSRESSTTRFSASLKHAYWRKIPLAGRHPSDAGDADDDSDADDYPATTPVRCYVVCFLLGFIFLFTLFSLILWGASKSYKPEISIKVRSNSADSSLFPYHFTHYFFDYAGSTRLGAFFFKKKKFNLSGRAWCSRVIISKQGWI